MKKNEKKTVLAKALTSLLMECYQKLQTADVHSYTISLNSRKK